MILDNRLLVGLIEKAQKSTRRRMNFNLHESLEARAQRLLNALEPGTELAIHRHAHTAESYILIRGRIDVVFYNDEREEIRRFHLDQLSGNFGVHIPKGQWHTIEVLESGSVIFEVKDGPYTPLTAENVLG